MCVAILGRPSSTTQSGPTGSESPCRARESRYHSRASQVRSIASWGVFPSMCKPVNAGQYAWNPSPSGSTTTDTLNFIGPPLSRPTVQPRQPPKSPAAAPESDSRPAPFAALLARRLSPAGSGRRGASQVSSISPVAIRPTCTAHATGSTGRHWPCGPFGMVAPRRHAVEAEQARLRFGWASRCVWAAGSDIACIAIVSPWYTTVIPQMARKAGQSEPKVKRVWLFFVGHPEGFGERHGKSYLTRRRRGEEGGGGGSVTGGTVPSV